MIELNMHYRYLLLQCMVSCHLGTTTPTVLDVELQSQAVEGGH